jgi:UPF0716 protein FxsA
MFQRLMVLFVIVPLVELILLIKIGKLIGAANTILIVIITGIVGAAFARQQGAGVLLSIRDSLAKGEIPGNQMLHGVMILVGGIFLITPGFLTDLAGLLLLVPFSRIIIGHYLLKYFRKRLRQQTFRVQTIEDIEEDEDQDDDNNPPPPVQ